MFPLGLDFVDGVDSAFLTRSGRSASAVAEKALQKPHGEAVDLMLPESQKGAAIAACAKEIELSDRNACDTELLIVG